LDFVYNEQYVEFAADLLHLPQVISLTDHNPALALY
jgi:hypothetical protein